MIQFCLVFVHQPLIESDSCYWKYDNDSLFGCIVIISVTAVTI
jgi:hypothetical protein